MPPQLIATMKIKGKILAQSQAEFKFRTSAPVLFPAAAPCDDLDSTRGARVVLLALRPVALFPHF